MADEAWHPMQRLEDAMNRLADMDAGWWPFLHLRPARSEEMDNRCLVNMAAHYGVPFGLLVYGWYVFVEFLPLSVAWLLVCVLVAMAFFFVASKFTFAVFWNRRARRIQREGRRRGAT